MTPYYNIFLIVHMNFFSIRFLIIIAVLLVTFPVFANHQLQFLIEWSPIAKKHVADGMTIAQLCRAAIIISDKN